MTEKQNSSKSTKLSLSDIQKQKSIDLDEDETIWYNLRYLQEDGISEYQGKIYELSSLEDCTHDDLSQFANDGYTHYGIFRLKDRSTSTFIQDESGDVYRVFSFSLGDAKVSYEIEIVSSDSS